jgi:hypothetical protein
MAKIELRHLDCTSDNYATVEVCKNSVKDKVKIDFYDTTTRTITPLILDRSTAIRFAKTLRTEINKIED